MKRKGNMKYLPFYMKLDPETAAALEYQSMASGMSKSGYVRFLIREGKKKLKVVER